MGAEGTKAAFLRVARGELGKAPYEHPVGSNSTRYNKTYGLDKAMWCNIWVWWVASHAEVPIIKSAYTPFTADWFRKHDRWFPGDRGQAGDCVFFNFPNDGLNRISHIGIVLRRLGPGRYLTIEGNVGNAVRVQERNMRSIVGFGRPRFGQDPKPPYRRGGMRLGSTGPLVKFLQQRLNEIAGPRGHDVLQHKPLKVTGTFDRDTERVVKVFQQHRHLTPSGIVGPRTYRRL